MSRGHSISFSQNFSLDDEFCRIFAIKIINKDTLDTSDLGMIESEVAFLRQV